MSALSDALVLEITRTPLSGVVEPRFKRVPVLAGTSKVHFRLDGPPDVVGDFRLILTRVPVQSCQKVGEVARILPVLSPDVCGVYSCRVILADCWVREIDIVAIPVAMIDRVGHPTSIYPLRRWNALRSTLNDPRTNSDLIARCLEMDEFPNFGLAGEIVFGFPYAAAEFKKRKLDMVQNQYTQPSGN